MALHKNQIINSKTFLIDKPRDWSMRDKITAEHKQSRDENSLSVDNVELYNYFFNAD